MGLKGVVEEIWLLIISNLPPTPSGAKKSLKLLIVTVNEKKKCWKQNYHDSEQSSLETGLAWHTHQADLLTREKKLSTWLPVCVGGARSTTWKPTDKQKQSGQTQEMTDVGIDLDAEVSKQGMVSSHAGSPVLWHRYQRLEDRSPRVSRVRDCAVFLHVCMCTCMYTQTHCETLENGTASYSLYIPAPTRVPGNSKCSLSAFEVENVE